MIGEKIEQLIKNKVVEILSKSKKIELPEDIIETDNIGEVIEKLAILHCRVWCLEDLIGIARTDEEVANLKRKIDICFKVKRPRYIETINRMIDSSIRENRSLVEDSVKLYGGFSNDVKTDDLTEPKNNITTEKLNDTEFSDIPTYRQYIESLKSNENIPLPPKPPPSRIIREGTIGDCPYCGSTRVRKYWFFGKKIGCINPDCENYYHGHNNDRTGNSGC